MFIEVFAATFVANGLLAFMIYNLVQIAKDEDKGGDGKWVHYGGVLFPLLMAGITVSLLMV